MRKIYKYFTEDLPITVSYINWFTKNFPLTEFKGVDLVLYLFLDYCSTLGVTAKRSYLQLFLSTELKVLVRKHNIRLDTLTAVFNYDEITAFEQAVQVISTSTTDTYDAYINEVSEEDDDFKVLLAEFMSTNLKDRIMNIFTEQFTLMNQGEDAINIADNTNLHLRAVKEIYDIDKISQLDFITGVRGSSEDNEGKEARLIAKTGIPAIDEDYGGMFSKALITFAGQPGSGKTRFLMAMFVYPTLVHFKHGVRVDSLELSDYEIENMLITIHIANVYKAKISDRNINRGDLTAEQKKIVASARIDLFESGKYGKLYLSTRDLVVESMKEDLISFLKLNRDVQLWCVDYVGLIKSNPVERWDRKHASEVIDLSLVIGKSVAKDADICSVFVNQYNDEGNKSAFVGKPITVGMIQGGQSIQRHSDFDVAITYTAEQKDAKLRMISSTKERAAVGFNFVPLSVDLAISRFTQINKIEERG